MAKVPFPYISGSIDDRSRFELERNFQYLTDQLAGTTVTGWDAIVDPTVAADNTSTKVFKTAFAAIKYVADTAGITDMTLGLRNTTTSVVETGNYGGSTSGLTVRLIAIGSTGVAAGAVAPSGSLQPTWDWHGFNESSKIQRLILAGLRFAKNDGAVTPNTTWFGGGVALWAVGCTIDGQGASSTTITCNMPGATAHNCSFTDVAFTGQATLLGCLVQYNRPTGTIAQTGATFYLGCTLTTVVSSCTLSLQSTSFVIIDGSTTPTSIGGPILTLAVTVAKQVSIKGHTPYGDGHGWAVLITSPNLRSVVLEGWFDEVTVPAAATGVGAAPHFISAAIKNRFDITGPANVSIAAHDGSVAVTYIGRLRGSGINGSVSVWVADSVTAATALDFIGAKRSVISASIALAGAASTGCKAYNFDASSANNILVLEADAIGGVSADAGANDLIITDATFGSSPTTATILADFSQAFMMGTL